MISVPVSVNVPESFHQTTCSITLTAYVPTNLSAQLSVDVFSSLEQDESESAPIAIRRLNVLLEEIIEGTFIGAN